MNGKYIVDIFQNHIEGNIIAYHDDYSLYNCLDNICPHFAINHSNGEYADGDICTNNAENRFSLLRPFLQKYRGISKYNLQEYATLCKFFFNERRETQDHINILMKFLEYIFSLFSILTFLQKHLEIFQPFSKNLMKKTKFLQNNKNK